MKTVVFDIDGVLLDLHSVLERRLRAEGYVDFSMSLVKTYDFNKTFVSQLKSYDLPLYLEQLPPHMRDTDYMGAPRQRIFEVLSDVTVFEEAELSRESIRLIKLLMDKSKDVNVIFHSVSYSSDIEAVKNRRLTEAFKGYEGRYKYVHSDGKDGKGIIENANFVVEDCIENLRQYDNVPDCERLLIMKPYNTRVYNPDHAEFFDMLNMELCGSTEKAIHRIFRMLNIAE